MTSSRLPVRSCVVALSLVVAGFASVGCASPTEPEATQGGGQDISQGKPAASDTMTPEKAASRILELAPLGAYKGATPQGANCSVTVSKIPQLGGLDNVRVVIAWLQGCAKEKCSANPPYSLNFDVYPALPNPPDQSPYRAATPVTEWKDTNGAVSFTVKYGGYNVANVELSDVAKKGSLQTKFTIPDLGMNGAVMECDELVAVDPASLRSDAQ
jgi:hypothetical protein